MNTKIIKSSRGHDIIVDESDYEWLSSYTWHVKNNGYAVRNYGGSLRLQVLMHRMILGLTDPKEKGDHKDRNKLNNTRDNLRLSTSRQNSCNRSKIKGTSSKYMGVSWFKRDKKWLVSIKHNNRSYHVGVFFSEVAAAMAYDEKARLFHGEFANLNFK